MFNVWGGKRWGWGYNKLKKLVLFFHKVGPGTWTQVSRLGSTCLYLLSHLICPKNISFANEQVIQKYQWWSEIRTSLCAQLQGPASSSPVPCPCNHMSISAAIHMRLVTTSISSSSDALCVRQSPCSVSHQHANREMVTPLWQLEPERMKILSPAQTTL